MDLILLHVFIVLQVAVASYIPTPQIFHDGRRQLRNSDGITNPIFRSPTSNQFIDGITTRNQLQHKSLPLYSPPELRNNLPSRADDPAYLAAQEVVGGYLQQEPEANVHHQNLDKAIKNRVDILLTLRSHVNKLIEDVGNTALSFVSKQNLFGGVTRRSLFDPANLDDIRLINTDLADIGGDIHTLYGKFVTDINNAIYYVSDHRNFSFENLFKNAFTAALGLFAWN